MIMEPMLGNEKHLIVSAHSDKAPKEGQVLCLTPIPFPADGAKVKIGRLDGQSVKSNPEPMAGKKKNSDDATASRPPPDAKPLP